MRLNVVLDDLHAATRAMGASTVEFGINLDIGALEPIDIALSEGFEVELKDIDYNHGLLSYKGRQVLLYIQDHGDRVADALADGITGRRFHIADCLTLEEMRKKKRFERYVATNDLSPDFFVSGRDWDTGEEIEGLARLRVCKNCLKKLNYQGYESGGGKRAIFEAFDLEGFFSAYSSFFVHMPSQFAGPNAKDNYTDDWDVIAGNYKAAQGNRCEACGLDLSSHRQLLHVHHQSGVKKDNNKSNLRALCAECHRKQPCHGHMFVSREQRRQINELRRAQGLLNVDNWADVFEFADPAVHGLATMCQQAKAPVPAVAYMVENARGSYVVELELAWPRIGVGISVGEDERTRAEANGWNVWEVGKALDDFGKFQIRLSSPRRAWKSQARPK